jgi:hypothetical protein
MRVEALRRHRRHLLAISWFSPSPEHWNLGARHSLPKKGFGTMAKSKSKFKILSKTHERGRLRVVCLVDVGDRETTMVAHVKDDKAIPASVDAFIERRNTPVETPDEADVLREQLRGFSDNALKSVLGVDDSKIAGIRGEVER